MNRTKAHWTGSKRGWTGLVKITDPDLNGTEPVLKYSELVWKPMNQTYKALNRFENQKNTWTEYKMPRTGLCWDEPRIAWTAANLIPNKNRRVPATKQRPSSPTARLDLADNDQISLENDHYTPKTLATMLRISVTRDGWWCLDGKVRGIVGYSRYPRPPKVRVIRETLENSQNNYKSWIIFFCLFIHSSIPLLIGLQG